MDSHQKPGSRHSPETGDVKNLNNMTIPELIRELKVTSRLKQYDEVEKILVNREAKLRDEADQMKQMVELEQLDRMKIEANLEECRKRCEEKNEVADLYEKLLADVKKNGFVDATFEELRAKNVKLEAELKIWEEKFRKLGDRMLNVENEIQLLLKKPIKERDYESNPGVTLLEVKEEVASDGGTGQRPSSPNRNVSANGRLGKGRSHIDIDGIVEISDSDDDSDDSGKKEGTSQFVTDNGHPNSSAATAQQGYNTINEDILGSLKRKYYFNLQRCPGNNTTDKRSKT